MKKRNYNASTPAQRAWQLLSNPQKNKLRKTYRQDPDKDGVPTGFDCKPYNKKKQESFLPADTEYIKAHPIIQLKTKGDKIYRLGEGTNGEVYAVKDNDRVVIKIGKGKAWNDIKSEANFHKKHKMSRLPLMTPLKEVKTDSGKYAIVKPVVKPILEPGNTVTNKSAFTDSRLKSLHDKLLVLSYKGYIFDDGLQLGIDKAGRLLQFDTGAIQHITPGSNVPFSKNNKLWVALLKSLKKDVSKFGEIKRSSTLDKKYMNGKSVTITIEPTRKSKTLSKSVCNKKHVSTRTKK